MKPRRIFLSSVQKEFATERTALRDYLHSDPLLRRFFDVFLFEDLPAIDHRTDTVYLEEVAGCDLYLGLFGNEYGYEDMAGISPTEQEFNHAS
jgi:ATP-dependent DNA helicase RecG